MSKKTSSANNQNKKNRWIFGISLFIGIQILSFFLLAKCIYGPLCFPTPLRLITVFIIQTIASQLIGFKLKVQKSQRFYLLKMMLVLFIVLLVFTYIQGPTVVGRGIQFPPYLAVNEGRVVQIVLISFAVLNSMHLFKIIKQKD